MSIAELFGDLKLDFPHALVMLLSELGVTGADALLAQDIAGMRDAGLMPPRHFRRLSRYVAKHGRRYPPVSLVSDDEAAGAGARRGGGGGGGGRAALARLSSLSPTDTGGALDAHPSVVAAAAAAAAGQPPAPAGAGLDYVLRENQQLRGDVQRLEAMVMELGSHLRPPQEQQQQPPPPVPQHPLHQHLQQQLHPPPPRQPVSITPSHPSIVARAAAAAVPLAHRRGEHPPAAAAGIFSATASAEQNGLQSPTRPPNLCDSGDPFAGAAPPEAPTSHAPMLGSHGVNLNLPGGYNGAVLGSHGMQIAAAAENAGPVVSLKGYFNNLSDTCTSSAAQQPPAARAPYDMNAVSPTPLASPTGGLGGAAARRGSSPPRLPLTLGSAAVVGQPAAATAASLHGDAARLDEMRGQQEMCAAFNQSGLGGRVSPTRFASGREEQKRHNSERLRSMARRIEEQKELVASKSSFVTAMETQAMRAPSSGGGDKASAASTAVRDGGPPASEEASAAAASATASAVPAETRSSTAAGAPRDSDSASHAGSRHASAHSRVSSRRRGGSGGGGGGGVSAGNSMVSAPDTPRSAVAAMPSEPEDRSGFLRVSGGGGGGGSQRSGLSSRGSMRSSLASGPLLSQRSNPFASHEEQAALDRMEARVSAATPQQQRRNSIREQASVISDMEARLEARRQEVESSRQSVLSSHCDSDTVDR